jgi:hypothetical protein
MDVVAVQGRKRVSFPDGDGFDLSSGFGCAVDGHDGLADKPVGSLSAVLRSPIAFYPTWGLGGGRSSDEIASGQRAPLENEPLY